MGLKVKSDLATIKEIGKDNPSLIGIHYDYDGDGDEGIVLIYLHTGSFSITGKKLLKSYSKFFDVMELINDGHLHRLGNTPDKSVSNFEVKFDFDCITYDSLSNLLYDFSRFVSVDYIYLYKESTEDWEVITKGLNRFVRLDSQFD